MCHPYYLQPIFYPALEEYFAAITQNDIQETVEIEEEEEIDITDFDELSSPPTIILDTPPIDDLPPQLTWEDLMEVSRQLEYQ